MNNHIKKIIENNPEAEFVIWMKNKTECDNVFQTLSELGYSCTIPTRPFKEMWDKAARDSNYLFGVKVKCYAKDCSFNNDLDHWRYYNYDIVEFTNPNDLEELKLMEYEEIPVEKKERLDGQQKKLNKTAQELTEYIQSINEEAQRILKEVKEDSKIKPGDWITTKLHVPNDELDPRDLDLVAQVAEDGTVLSVFKFYFGFHPKSGGYQRYLLFKPEDARKIPIEDVLKILNKDIRKNDRRRNQRTEKE